MSSFDQLLDVDPAKASPQARQELLGEFVKLERWAQANQQRMLAAIAVDPEGIGVSEAARAAAGDLARKLDEKHYEYDALACALRIPYQAVADRLYVATTLVHRLPDTLEAFSEGVIGMPHCLRLVERAGHLPDDKLAKVEARVLPSAATKTNSQFSRAVTAAVLAVEGPCEQAERASRAIADRKVCTRPAADGMAELWMLLAATDVNAVLGKLNARADHLKTLDDGRTADQRRADAMVDLVLGVDTGDDTADDTVDPRIAGTSRPGRRPHVQVTVAMSTLLGLDEQPGQLTGHGPIPAVLARELAHDPTGTWRRLLTDEHGVLLDYGRTTYRPPARLEAFVAAKQQHCRMPGCNRPAIRCETDHRQAWADGGTTSEANLWPLCIRHHHLKHQAGWTYQLDPDGTAEWTTPTGHTYVDPPQQLPVDHTTDPPLELPPPTEPDPPPDVPPPF